NATKPKHPAYIEFQPAQSSLHFDSAQGVKNGKFVDDASQRLGSDDSDLPEFLDSFSDPMPFIYAPARVGLDGVIVDDIANPQATAQYHKSDFFPYTFPLSGKTIGVGKRIKRSDYVNPGFPPPNSGGMWPHGLVTVDSNTTIHKNKKDYSNKQNTLYVYPYDCWAYLVSPDYENQDPPNQQPRGKDTFILISAGIDRVYGTEDDIC